MGFAAGKRNLFNLGLPECRHTAAKNMDNSTIRRDATAQVPQITLSPTHSNPNKHSSNLGTKKVNLTNTRLPRDRIGKLCFFNWRIVEIEIKRLIKEKNNSVQVK